MEASPPYNNNMQVSIVEGKIVIFRITSGVILTPDITIPYVDAKYQKIINTLTLPCIGDSITKHQY